MSSLGRRVAVTLLLPVVVVVAAWVPPAGVDVEALRGLYGASNLPPLNLSVIQLGIMPAMQAFALVEIAAMIVPRWRGLRHETPAGRRKLERAARVVFVLLSLFQTLGMVLYLRGASGFMGEEPLPGTLASVVFGASLMGGAFALFLLAEWVTRQGLVNGFLGIAAVLSGADAVRVLAGPTWYLSRIYIAIVFVLFAAVSSLATWLAVRKLGPSDLTGTEPTGTPYRGSAKDEPAWAPVIPTPSSSIEPYWLAMAGLVSLGAWDAVLRLSTPAVLALGLVASLVLARIVGRLLQRPADVASVLLRLGAKEPRALLEDQARTRLRAAERSTWLYFVALTVASGLADMTRETRLPVTMIPVALALGMDFWAGVRGRAADAVCVWEERRTHAAMAVVQALANQGIRATPAGVATHSLLQIFAPFAPVTIWVSPADAERASAFLADRLGGKGHEEGAHEALLRVPAGWAPRKRFRALLTVVCTLLAVGLLIVANDALKGSEKSETLPRATRELPRATLELAEVDDEVALDIPESELPVGASFSESQAPAGPGRSVASRSIRFTLQNGETAEAARARAASWLATQRLPEGRRFALEDITEYGEDDTGGGGRGVVAVQTVVLQGEPILTGRHVASADAVPPRAGQSAQVAVTLTSDGARRFEEATGRLVRRRIAILTSGVVRSVPVVQSKIGGGHVSITMGAGSPEKQYEEAKQLAADLGGK